MTAAPAADLKWTAQLTVSAPEQTPKLIGDKITLPQSALEQLLDAATVTVVSDATPPQNFDPFNPYTFAAAQRSRVLERQQNLPHPLTFRLVNPENGNVVYAGVREFSAEEATIGLSPFLKAALALSEPLATVTVHVQNLPKGTHVRFRPLEAGYDPDDWKALLERQLRTTFTTLTKGEVLQIRSGSDEYRFLIDEIQPEGDGICIVDTDLEVDIEALNEEQARETLQKRSEKNAVKTASGDSSIGGILDVGRVETGQVIPGDYVDYTLEKWDSQMDLGIEVQVESGTTDVFVSFLSHLQRERPREDAHQLNSVSDAQSHIVRLRNANEAFFGADSIYLSIHGLGQTTATYSLLVRPTTDQDVAQGNQDVPPNEGEVRCKNCKQRVPQRTMMLHENFCFRNNVFCPKCEQVFKKQSDEWKDHWHCDEHAAHGSHVESLSHHNSMFHEPATCKACGYAATSVADLATHRTSKCPEKIILCQFCHLLVPQKGPDDLDINDPEVIMSGLTPHELSDGSTTTECHICSKIVRLRDMTTHLRHHDMDRLICPRPRVCRNVLCGNAVSASGDNKPASNELGLCDTCFGPLYNSAFDPDHKALKRRVERRYLGQMITGCGKPWCRNQDFCKTAALNAGAEPMGFKAAGAKIKPVLDSLMLDTPLHFCTDEGCQRRRSLAEMIASEDGEQGYDFSWCIVAAEAGKGDLDRTRDWLKDRAPKRGEERL